MKNKGLNGWIEIFKGGMQVDSRGRVQDGDALIDKAVKTFDPKSHEPPHVIGHPKDNAPSYGWVKKLKSEVVSGVKTLFAKSKDIVPEFAEMVEKRRFPKRSASFYTDGRLRHVGWLGAMPPAVKGLSDVAFAEDDDSITIEFGETHPWTWQAIMEVFRNLREWFIENHGSQTANALIPEWRLEDLAEQKKEAELTPGEKGDQEMEFKDFIEFVKFWDKRGGTGLQPPDNGDDGVKSFSEADLKAAEKKAAAKAEEKAKADFAEEERKRLKSASDKNVADFVDKGVEDGKIAPAWKDAGIVSFMQSLDSAEATEFAEGGEKKTGLQWFRDFLEGLPKLVDFSELATTDKAAGAAFAEGKIPDDITMKV